MNTLFTVLLTRPRFRFFRNEFISEEFCNLLQRGFKTIEDDVKLIRLVTDNMRHDWLASTADTLTVPLHTDTLPLRISFDLVAKFLKIIFKNQNYSRIETK